MKAIVKLERVYGAVQIKDLAKPKIKPGQVLIKIKASAICGSDLHVYEYSPEFAFMNIPVTLGHEYSGVVEAVGKNVEQFEIGDRVMAESNQFCGSCPNCRKGSTQICLDNRMTGIHIDGGMAEYICVPERIVHKLPERVSFAAAAVAQPCAVSFHAVFNNSTIKPADTVLVFGPGIVGLMAAQGARIMGAGQVVVVGIDADEKIRLPIAKKLGFATINGQSKDIKEELKKLAGCEVADVAVEASGSPSAVGQAINLVKKGGGITIIGIYAQPLELALTTLVRSEITLKTSYTCNWENYEQALLLIESGQVDLKPLLKLYKFVNFKQAFEDGLNKTVLKPVLLLD